jgi:hypothetical protein
VSRVWSIGGILLGIGLAAAITVGAIALDAPKAPTKIRIIYTDDMMGEWQPCG